MSFSDNYNIAFSDNYNITSDLYITINFQLNTTSGSIITIYYIV